MASRAMQLVDERGVVRLPRVLLAEGFLSRALGLLLRAPLREGEGLLLRPCRGVHTFGMRYAIDVVMLDRHLRVRAVHRAVPPFRIVRGRRSTAAVLELASGGAGRAGLRVGERLALVEPPDPRLGRALERWMRADEARRAREEAL